MVIQSNYRYLKGRPHPIRLMIRMIGHLLFRTSRINWLSEISHSRLPRRICADCSEYVFQFMNSLIIVSLGFWKCSRHSNSEKGRRDKSRVWICRNVNSLRSPDCSGTMSSMNILNAIVFFIPGSIATYSFIRT